MLPAGFESMIQQHQSPYGGQNYQSAAIGPFDGLPIPGGVLGEVGFQMLVAPQLQSAMTSNGYIPGGFRGHQNLYDRQRAIETQNRRQTIVNNAAKLEQTHLRETIGGVNQLFSMGMSDSSIQATAANTAAMAPMMAQMAPGLLSELGGRRGSSTLMSMRMLEAPDRIDSVTGQSGMTTESMNELTNNLYRDTYLSGDPLARKNVKAEDMGAIYGQLARSGMLAPPSGTRRQRGLAAYNELSKTSPEIADKIREESGLGPVPTEGQFEALGNGEIDAMMKTKTLQKAVRNKDSSQIKQTLDSYTEMVSAMKDIFGANGETNAPMSKVWAGLEAMTGGVAAVKNKDKMALQIRSIGELAKQSGVGMDELGMMNQQIGQKLANNALPAALQSKMLESSLLDRRVYDMIGVGAGAGMGSMTKAERLEYEENMRMGAATSSEARNISAVLSAADSQPNAKPSAAMKSLREAIANQKTEFSYRDDAGKLVTTKTSDLGRDEVAKSFIAKELNLTAGQANAAMQDEQGINRAKVGYDVTGAVSANHPLEQRKVIGEDVANKTAKDVGNIAKLGEVDSLRAAVLIEKARSTSLLTALNDKPSLANGSVDSRKELQQLQLSAVKEAIAKSADPALQATQAALSKESSEESDRLVQNIITAQNQAADTVTKSATTVNSESELLLMQTDKAKAGRKIVSDQAKKDAKLAGAVSGLTNGTMISNTISALADVQSPLTDKDGKFTKEATNIAMRSMGGLKKTDIEGVLQESLLAAAKTEQELREVNEKLTEQDSNNLKDGLTPAQVEAGQKISNELAAKKDQLEENSRKQQDELRLFLPEDGKKLNGRQTAEDFENSATQFKSSGDKAADYKAKNFNQSIIGGKLYETTAAKRHEQLQTNEGARALRSANAEHVLAGDLIESIQNDSDLTRDFSDEEKDNLAELTRNQAELDLLASNYSDGDAGKLSMGAIREYDAQRDTEYKTPAAYQAAVVARAAKAKQARDKLIPTVAKSAETAAEDAAEKGQRLSSTDRTAVTQYGKLLNEKDELETSTGLKGARLIEDEDGRRVAVADYTYADGKTEEIRLDSMGDIQAEHLGAGTKDERAKLAATTHKAADLRQIVQRAANTNKREYEPLVEQGKADAKKASEQQEKTRVFKSQTHNVAASEEDAQQAFGSDFDEPQLRSRGQKTALGLDASNLSATVAAQRNVLETAEWYMDPDNEVANSKRTLADAESHATQLYAELGGDKLDNSKVSEIAKSKRIEEAALKKFHADYQTVEPIYELRNSSSERYNKATMDGGETPSAERSVNRETASNRATQAATQETPTTVSTGNTAPVAISGKLSINLETGVGRLEGSMPNAAAIS